MPRFFSSGGKQNLPFTSSSMRRSRSGPLVRSAAGMVGIDQGISFFPDLGSFLPLTMDVLTGSGGLPPPGPTRYSALSIYLTGVFLEGHRTKVAAKDAYTHLILADPTVTIYDSYGNLGRNNSPDALAIPAGQSNNYWFVVFSFITNVPEFGRRLVIAADRFGTPGNWTALV